MTGPVRRGHGVTVARHPSGLTGSDSATGAAANLLDQGGTLSQLWQAPANLIDQVYGDPGPGQVAGGMDGAGRAALAGTVCSAARCNPLASAAL